MERRSFLGLLAWGAVAAAASLTGLLGAVVLGAPLRRRKAPRWVLAANLSDISSGYAPALIQYDAEDGWRRIVRRETVFLRSADGQSVEALSAVCTHLGCSVRWQPAEGLFRCPCHQGTFDAQGRVTSGPPPTSLRRYPIQVRDGAVYVEVA